MEFPCSFPAAVGMRPPKRSTAEAIERPSLDRLATVRQRLEGAVSHVLYSYWAESKGLPRPDSA
jgi:hypothetical protein